MAARLGDEGLLVTMQGCFKQPRERRTVCVASVRRDGPEPGRRGTVMTMSKMLAG